ncbi:MAG: hypothetical protein MJ252_05465 [archaeon]|nr:hypothetical protein [archaeon]
MSTNNFPNIDPSSFSQQNKLIKIKRLIAYIPTFIILPLNIISMIYTLHKNRMHYMDYISFIYIFLIFVMSILGTIKRRCLCKTIRRNFGLFSNNKAKGAIFLLISFVFFGNTKNTFHTVMNILLTVLGLLFLVLDILIIGEWDKEEKVQTVIVNDGIYSGDKANENIEASHGNQQSENSLDNSGSDPQNNNPYAIPDDF